MSLKYCLPVPALLFTCLLIELFLRLTDPLSISMKYEDWIALDTTRNAAGITLPSPGVHRLTESTLTINEQGFRMLPDAAQTGDCTIAWIGDSVTFGYGVSDHETFANLIAAQFPEVRFISAAASGADNLQLLWLMDNTPADGYLHLIWENDARDTKRTGTWGTTIVWGDRQIFTWWYAKHMYEVYSDPPEPLAMDDFYAALDGMYRDNSLFFVLSSNPYLDGIVRRYPEAVVIDWQYDQISWSDSHPDEAGHREAVRLMMPAVEGFVKEICQ